MGSVKLKMIKNLLITGLPGTGKTTLVKKLSSELRERAPYGFYTEEIREKGARRGFELVALTGQRALLASVDIESPFRVGKYHGDIKGFERFLDSLDLLNQKTNLIVIDEIGKMECLSKKFIDLLRALLDSRTILIATIALKGGGFIEEVKNRQDVKVFEIEPKNRNFIGEEIKRYCLNLEFTI